jgi:hypothetical protein
MNFKNSIKISFLFLLPVLYTIIIGRYGLEDSDSGFLIGMGWRIYNGELPYNDFLYIRPPLSPYLSALYLWLTPNFGQVFLLRLINNFQLLIQVILTLLILRKKYNFEILKINLFKFIILCYFITLTGTLNFQWHTTDGVLFAVIGFFLLIYFENKNIVYVVSGLFFCASMLTKQNFIIVPFLCFLYVYFEKGYAKSILVTLGTIIGLILFYFFLTYNSLLENYLTLTTGATKLNDLFIAGFAFYFVKHDYLFLYVSIIIILSIIFYSLHNKNVFTFLKLKIEVFILLISFIILFLFSIFYVFIFESSERVIAFDRILPIIVCVAFLYLFLLSKELLKNHYTLLVLIGISWSSSISWGGMTPIMYFTPIIFATYYLLRIYSESLNNQIVNHFIYFLIIGTSIIHKIVPYRNGFLWKNKNDGIVLTDKLAFIKVNNDFYNKHLEYKTISSKYKNVTILPSMPGTSYLYDQKNPFIIDWAMDVESNFNTNMLYKKINTCCDYILVEKKVLGQPIGVSGKFYSSVTNYVINNFKLINRNYNYFDVYQKITNK